MKKTLITLLLTLLLVGCSSDKNSVTVCSSKEASIHYETTEQIYTADGNKVLKLEKNSVIAFDSAEDVAAAIESVKDDFEILNTIPGIKVSFEVQNETEIKEIWVIDFDVVDFETLDELGMFPGSDLAGTDYISLKESVKLLESEGFSCKVN